MPRMALLTATGARSFAVLLALLMSSLAADALAAGDDPLLSQLKVQSSGFRVDRRTGEFVQAVTITNTGRNDVARDFALVLRDLDPAITVRMGDSRAAAVREARGAILTLQNAARGASAALKPGERVVSVLRFTVPGNRPVRYQLQLVRNP